MVSYPPIINILSKSVRNVGKKVVRDYSEIEKLQNSLKTPANFVQKTNDKIKINLSSILTKLKKELFISNLNSKNNSNCWILEPIDSLKNFSRGIPSFCCVIGKIEDDIMQSCVIYNPISDDLSVFYKGSGGYQNGQRMRVSYMKKLNNSFIGVYRENEEYNDLKITELIRENLSEKSVTFRESGSLFSDICNVGYGKLDCCLSVNIPSNSQKICSMIIQETGGLSYNIKIGSTCLSIFSNKSIGNFIKEMIKDSNEKK